MNLKPGHSHFLRSEEEEKRMKLDSFEKIMLIIICLNILLWGILDSNISATIGFFMSGILVILRAVERNNHGFNIVGQPVTKLKEENIMDTGEGRFEMFDVDHDLIKETFEYRNPGKFKSLEETE
jgi:hypothetical protein